MWHEWLLSVNRVRYAQDALKNVLQRKATAITTALESWRKENPNDPASCSLGFGKLQFSVDFTWRLGIVCFQVRFVGHSFISPFFGGYISGGPAGPPHRSGEGTGGSCHLLDGPWDGCRLP